MLKYKLMTSPEMLHEIKPVVAEFSPRILGQPEEAVKVAKEHPEYRVIVAAALGRSSLAPVGLTTRLKEYAESIEQNNQLKAKIFQNQIINVFDFLYSGLLAQEKRDTLRATAIRRLRPTPIKDESFYPTVDPQLNGLYLAESTDSIYEEPKILFTDGEFNGKVSRIKIKHQLREHTRNYPEKQLIIPGSFGTDVFGKTHLLSNNELEGTSSIYAERLGWDRVVVE